LSIQHIKSGLIPRLFYEASTIALTSFLSYVVKKYLFEEKEFEVFVDLIASVWRVQLQIGLILPVQSI
jgi:hypothetical protein